MTSVFERSIETSSIYRRDETGDFPTPGVAGTKRKA
jgi:hypothetical protein